MKALILGVTGMVGSHLLDHLLEHTDWDIVGACRWRSPLDNVDHIIGDDRVTFDYADINDFGSLMILFNKHKPDYVFHLAAQSYPQDSFKMVSSTLQTNVIGTANVLETIKQLELDPVIHVCSSSEVFGRVPKEFVPIDEEVKYHPASPYAISKVGTDMLGRYYAEAYGMKTLTTRMFTHTGPRRGDVFAESTFAKQIALIEAGKQAPIVYVGNLNSMRTWADVRDAVNAYHILVTSNPVYGEYYNIGGDYSCTIGGMLDTLLAFSTMGNVIDVVVDKERLRPIDADLQIPNTTKFKTHTGWQPTYTFEQTMEDLLNYWRERVVTNNFLNR
jgi:GDP-mannose 4,6-dehydratase